MKNIVAIGGGAGTYNVLYGLKNNLKLNISAIISVADNGGTTGSIRDKYGILPPGDFRRAVAALAKRTDMVRKLFEYKFETEKGVIGANKIGNILLTALVDIEQDYEKGLNMMCEMFDVRGRVIPVTLEDVHLGVEFEDGTKIIGEKNIDISDKNPGERTHDPDQSIINAWLEGGNGTTLNPTAREAILNADYIIIGPGDLYTSIVPNLLCEGMKEALDETSAKLIYICNAMTKRGETSNMEVIDFVNVIERYIEPGKLDYVIVNSGHIDDEMVEKYKKIENKKPVKIKDHSIFRDKSYKIIERDIVNDEDVVRHNPKKLAKIIEDILDGWIK
ncbi:YvcK family protein [Candidatus Gracilibacteria bacterium]|nr:YvcK family protein [Candidatus Gracilibacteria bacterium]